MGRGAGTARAAGAALALGAALLLAVASAAPARADIVRLDAVGVAPIGGSGEGAGNLRQAAFEWAVRDAVRKVASQQLAGRSLPGDYQPDPSGRRETARERRERLLDEALGDPLDYTTRFRILEDRGERPALLSREEGVEREYVVVVEVHVDADRVRQSLASRGLLAPPAPSGDPRLGGRVLLVVEAASYREVRRLRELLEEQLGADSVLPVEMQRGRTVLAVRGAGSPGAVERALRNARPPDLAIEPVGRSADGLRVRLRLLQPTAAAPAAARRRPAD